MENSEFDRQDSKNNTEYRNLATNTLFSFMFNYSSLFFTFIYSFLLARLFIDVIWGYLITATSFIVIIVVITSLLPPGAKFTLNYYIPRYFALNEKKKIKSLIRNIVLIKLIFLIPLFGISVLLFQLFANFLVDPLVSLFFILSPCILINSLNYVVESINRGFNKFHYNFLFLVVKNIIHISPLLIFFIFKIEIGIEIIAWVVLISSLIPFLLNSIFVIFMVHKIESTGNNPDSFKEDISKTFKYGSFLSFDDLIDKLWTQSQIQGIGYIISYDAVTGYNIAQNYKKLTDYVTTSFNFPLLNSFTTLNTKKNFEQIEIIYRISYKVTLFVLLIISGVLFFCVEFVLDFVFLEDRLIYSNFLRLIILASIFKILMIFVQSHLNAQHKVKLTLILKIIYTSISIPLFFIGLFFFGVEGAIIYGLILGNILSMIIQIYATYKYGNIKLSIKKIAIQYITFFIPLSITIILKEFIFKNATEEFILLLGFSLFKNLDFLSIFTFLILFIITNFLLRTVNSSDISYFQSFLDKNRFFDKIMLKSLNITKKFTRK
ncbi:MAG: lipopolysaccharide biosynthesis protein [Promethearchaeota archaeon]